MLEFMKECFTDKGLVIIALLVIALYSLFIMGASAESVVTAIVSGLCGIAVGKSL